MQGGNENGLHGLQAFSTRIHRCLLLGEAFVFDFFSAFCLFFFRSLFLFLQSILSSSLLFFSLVFSPLLLCFFLFFVSPCWFGSVICCLRDNRHSFVSVLKGSPEGPSVLWFSLSPSFFSGSFPLFFFPPMLCVSLFFLCSFPVCLPSMFVFFFSSLSPLCHVELQIHMRTCFSKNCSIVTD